MSADGKNTSERILDAACELFAERGFAGTTTQDICSLANANIAAVNYHFRSKENLYREVWAHLDRLAMARRAEADSESLSPEERLRLFVHRRVKSVLLGGSESLFPRIVHCEMGNPSPLHEELMKTHMFKRHEWFVELVREICNGALDERQMRMAGFCIHSPLIHLMEMRSRPKPPRPCRHKGPDEDADELAETLFIFALSGLRELARRNRKATGDEA